MFGFDRFFSYGALLPCASLKAGSTFQFLLFAAVLCLTDLLHPVDDLTVERFLNGDVRHRARWHCAVPMFFVRREPDHVARPDFLDRSAFALRPSQTGDDDQRLTEWMRMPGSARTRLESDARATNARWGRCLE